jgi:AcrR family transcriptional regulator
VRPLRADARRNREAILTAADELFRADGSAIQMDAVAHCAKVGVGTLYRHFPTKEALVVELVIHRLETCLDEAERALNEEDSAVAMRKFITGLVDVMADDAGLREVLGTFDQDECQFYREELHHRKVALVTRAQADGIVRPDLTADDFGGLMCGLGAAMQAGASARMVGEVLLDGLHVPRVAQVGD